MFGGMITRTAADLLETPLLPPPPPVTGVSVVALQSKMAQEQVDQLEF